LNLKEISPKVYVPVAVAVLAGVALYLLTGDKTFLISVLVSLAAGGAGVAAKPAPGVTQKEVAALSRVRQMPKPPPAPPTGPTPPAPPSS
jgi:hypothetical protein